MTPSVHHCVSAGDNLPGGRQESRGWQRDRDRLTVGEKDEPDELRGVLDRTHCRGKKLSEICASRFVARKPLGTHGVAPMFLGAGLLRPLFCRRPSVAIPTQLKLVCNKNLSWGLRHLSLTSTRRKNTETSTASAPFLADNAKSYQHKSVPVQDADDLRRCAPC